MSDKAFEAWKVENLNCLHTGSAAFDILLRRSCEAAHKLGQAKGIVAGQRQGMEHALALIGDERLSCLCDDTDEAYERALDHITEAIHKEIGHERTREKLQVFDTITDDCKWQNLYRFIAVAKYGKLTTASIADAADDFHHETQKKQLAIIAEWRRVDHE